MIIFPEKRFPENVSRVFFSRTRRFPERRFPDRHFPGKWFPKGSLMTVESSSLFRFAECVTVKTYF